MIDRDPDAENNGIPYFKDFYEGWNLTKERAEFLFRKDHKELISKISFIQAVDADPKTGRPWIPIAGTII